MGARIPASARVNDNPGNARDLDDLLLGGGEPSRCLGRIDPFADAEPLEDRRGCALRFAPRIEDPAQSGFGAEQDVLGDAEIGNDHQLLEDRDDSSSAGVARRGERNVCAIDRERALVGLHVAGQDADQRRLAGAVLSHQRVHLAAAQVQRDIAQRPHGRVVLADPFRRDDGRIGRHRNSGCRRHVSSSRANLPRLRALLRPLLRHDRKG